MKSDEYCRLIASYIDQNFRSQGLAVYTEVSLGKTIIGKNRRLDVFVLRESDQRALAIECKYQDSKGTTDEKIPYALQDLEAMWVPGCLTYAGTGWSKGVLHTLEGSRLAVYCHPPTDLQRKRNDPATRELDHVLAAVFGLWHFVIPRQNLLSQRAQLDLPLKGPRKTTPKPEPNAIPTKKAGES